MATYTRPEVLRQLGIPEQPKDTGTDLSSITNHKQVKNAISYYSEILAGIDIGSRQTLDKFDQFYSKAEKESHKKASAYRRQSVEAYDRAVELSFQDEYNPEITMEIGRYQELRQKAEDILKPHIIRKLAVDKLLNKSLGGSGYSIQAKRSEVTNRFTKYFTDKWNELEDEAREAEEIRRATNDHSGYLDSLTAGVEETLNGLFLERTIGPIYAGTQVVHIDGNLDTESIVTLFTEDPDKIVSELREIIKLPETELTLMEDTDIIPLDNGTTMIQPKYRASKKLHP